MPDWADKPMWRDTVRGFKFDFAWPNDTDQWDDGVSVEDIQEALMETSMQQEIDKQDETQTREMDLDISSAARQLGRLRYTVAIFQSLEHTPLQTLVVDWGNREADDDL
ncbi:hypothetical protein R1sor_008781 [Riccia sorocarpa]|uniref:Uncharacterized protein n=1 Tax=Riccia sorocarpa TaxID=122646 RepID=A0ABD3HUE9_9MARC